MDKEMTLKLIDEAVECLYQNREKEAMQKVSALLIIYENMAKKGLKVRMEVCLM